MIHKLRAITQDSGNILKLNTLWKSLDSPVVYIAGTLVVGIGNKKLSYRIGNTLRLDSPVQSGSNLNSSQLYRHRFKVKGQ